MTRPPPMYSNFFCTPRFSSSSFRIPPRYSSRVITVASMMGSSICLISEGSGNLVGLFTSMISPTVVVIRYRTPGAVVEPQFFERVAQQAVLMGFHRVQAGEHHRLDLFEAGERLHGRSLVVHD